MSKPQRIALPRTRDELEELAWQARGALGLAPFDRVPVARVLEHVLPELIDDYQFRVVEHGELGGAEAITDFNKPIITFDNQVYDGLARDLARPRMTGAHELGHLLMHTGRTFMAFLPRADARVNIERQADVFAAAFLMPECAFREVKSIAEAMRKFGVSRDAACCRARALGMQSLIRGKPISSKKSKKKGYDKRRTP